jgi:hypothetical protein
MMHEGVVATRESTESLRRKQDGIRHLIVQSHAQSNKIELRYATTVK